jgi:hypothetical protein
MTARSPSSSIPTSFFKPNRGRDEPYSFLVAAGRAHRHTWILRRVVGGLTLFEES